MMIMMMNLKILNLWIFLLDKLHRKHLKDNLDNNLQKIKKRLHFPIQIINQQLNKVIRTNLKQEKYQLVEKNKIYLTNKLMNNYNNKMMIDHVKLLFLEQLIQENLQYLEIFILVYMIKIKIEKNHIQLYLIILNMNNKVVKQHKYVIIK